MNHNFQVSSTFPGPPPGKMGWPWASSLPLFEPLMPNGDSWPKISIVTPSFNQGEFLEETIRSVLLQNYPNLEYIIIDGGSNDTSVEIIKKYAPWIKFWVSEQDNGQAHAINKGLGHCTGDIFNWINSDDYLEDGALKIIANNIVGYDAVAGAVLNFDGTIKTLVQSAALSADKMISGDISVIYQQPGTWLRVEKLKEVGGAPEGLHFSFDWLMTVNYLNSFIKVKYINDVLANFRLHNKSKTVNSGSDFRREIMLISIDLMYRKDFYAKYGCRAFQCLHKSLWIEEIDRLNSADGPRIIKIKTILYALFWNIISYPYRYGLGAIKKLMF
jgi:glycosyltransferase involved in cell wall biosynthesis